MKTLERKTTEREAAQRPVETKEMTRSTRSRSTWLVAIVAVFALILGALGGWAIRGSDSDGDAAAYLAGEGELTDRQLEMVDIVSDYAEAWRSGDGEAVAAFYTSGGRFTTYGNTYRAGDGSLAEFVDGGAWKSLTDFEPVLVKDNVVASIHRFSGTFGNVFVFTTTGEPLIVLHAISP